MKRVLLAMLLAVLAGAPLACRKAEMPHAADAQVQKAADVYWCPMHPSIVSDKPGSCPICGMALVKRTETPASSSTGVTLSPEQRVAANVRTVRVVPAAQATDLVTTGRVTFDERRVAQITAYTGGRIERLFVNFTGDTVRRGQAVGTIYSPDLFATQQEYLLALDNRARMQRAGFSGPRSAADDLVESTRRRLLLSGMSAAQIAQIDRTRQPITATTVVSPVAGVVTRKLAVEQQYVAQGQPLLEVADLSTVWVEADVYEQQLPTVKAGDRVEITAAAVPGRTFGGTVSFITPVLTGATRTARVRIELANRALQLKPDMYVSVRILGAPAEPHLAVPASAVVDRGQSQFVWVETRPGTYEPRQVTTAGRQGDTVAILSGLREGESVVVQGGFLLDSEAQLRSATRDHTSR